MEAQKILYLETAVRTGSSLLVISSLLDSIPEKEKIRACLICRESSNVEVRASAYACAAQLKKEFVLGELKTLLDKQSSENENVREFCRRQFSSFTSRQLSEVALVLFEALESNFTLTRYYAEELLMKIDEPDIVPILELVYEKHCSKLLDSRRVAREMIIKAISAWSIDEITSNISFIKKLQLLDNCQKLKEIGDRAFVLFLFHKSSLEEIKEQESFLFSCRLSKSDDIHEITALVLLRLMNSWTLTQLEEEIDYLTDLRHCFRSEIRQSSRDLALTVIESWESIEKIYGKFEFLVHCRASKFFSIRHRAKLLLEKIPAEYFVKDIAKLVSMHAFLEPKLCAVIRKIMFSIPADFYAEYLQTLFEMQKTNDFEQNLLGRELALRIGRQKLLEKQDHISFYKQIGCKESVNLANDLEAIIG